MVSKEYVPRDRKRQMTLNSERVREDTKWGEIQCVIHKTKQHRKQLPMSKTTNVATLYVLCERVGRA